PLACVSLLRPPPTPTLFPYTTLFRSGSSGGFLLAFLACFDAGARLALARPGYPPYFSIQKALNIEPLPVDVDETTAFQLTADHVDRKSTRLNSSHVKISYAVFCLKKK